MQINKSNYEIWFIDWLDGNLNEIQVEELTNFLKENPDLKAEFDEINTVKIKPSEKTFPNKSNLKKSTANVTDSQFEYLCIAYFENDLSQEQSMELREIINSDFEKRRIFELFQKTKLTPATVSFNGKNSLIRRNIGQNVVRLAIIGLSAAAVIIFGIIEFNSNPNLLKYQKTALNIQAPIGNGRDRSLYLDYDTNVSKKIISDASARIVIQSLNLLTHSPKMTNTAENNPALKDSVATTVRPSITIEKVVFSSEITLERSEISGSIVAFNSEIVIPSDNDDGQSRFSKFLAKAIRGKLLREKTPKDSPLKGYEIAEAGITGLNKLFGWEMALDERKDENGNLKSVYFSSKLLKFNAPVNKTESIK